MDVEPFAENAVNLRGLGAGANIFGNRRGCGARTETS